MDNSKPNLDYQLSKLRSWSNLKENILSSVVCHEKDLGQLQL